MDFSKAKTPRKREPKETTRRGARKERILGQEDAIRPHYG